MTEVVYTVFDKKEDSGSHKQRRTVTAETDGRDRRLPFTKSNRFWGTDQDKSVSLTISCHDYTLETANVHCHFAWRKRRVTMQAHSAVDSYQVQLSRKARGHILAIAVRAKQLSGSHMPTHMTAAGHHAEVHDKRIAHGGGFDQFRLAVKLEVPA